MSEPNPSPPGSRDKPEGLRFPAWPEHDVPLADGRTWRIGPRPAIMGVLNVTPDSFSDGGVHLDPGRAAESASRMVEEGADIIDVGGESTRPGASAVPANEQIARVLPVVERVRRGSDVLISVDTREPAVGEAAIGAGADVLNDVSAFRARGWSSVLRRHAVPVVVMHMRGSPDTMQSLTRYERGVLAEVEDALGRRVEELERSGVERRRQILDPGFGFAKEYLQNLQLLSGLSRLRRLGRPLLVGLSRKSFLGRAVSRDDVADPPPPREREGATVAANALALLGGASILRVHKVSWCRHLVDVFLEVDRAGSQQATTE